MRAYQKDIFRTILGEKKRLLALMLISMLGVTMMTGLRASCDDLRTSADRLFDSQRLHDLSVVSTLGLTDADVQALQALPGILQAEGVYTEKVQLVTPGGTVEAQISTFTPEGLDVPYVTEGRLPENAFEVAVSRDFLTDTGMKLGDTLVILETLAEPEPAAESDLEGLEELEETETPNLPNTSFTIVGAVVDVTAVINPAGTTSFRSSETRVCHCFLLPEAVVSDYYTAVNLSVRDTAALSSFSEDYDRLVSAAKQDMEQSLMAQREQARYDAVLEEATEKLSKAQRKVDDAFADAEAQLADARKELDDGWVELRDGEAQLEAESADAMQKLADARQELEDGWKALEDGKIQLQDAEETLSEGEAELEANALTLADGFRQLSEGKAQLDAGKDQLTAQQTEILSQLEGGLMQAKAGLTQIEEALAQMPPVLPPEYEAQKTALLEQKAALEATIAELEAQKTAAEAQFRGAWDEISLQEAQLLAAEAELEAGQQALNEGRAELEAGRTELAEKKAEAEQAEADLLEGQRELDKAEAEAAQEIADARQELEDGRQELEDGEAEYADGLAEYLDKKADAEARMADAWQELEDIGDCIWYVRDRGAMDGFADISSDADCIQSIGTFFPVMFLLVAVLISLTTVTRMVDENRGLIGTYQALGFTDVEIRRKYVVFAFLSALLGGILGNLAGYIAVPKILIIIFRTMYLVPDYTLAYSLPMGVGSAALFCAAIAGTTVISCQSALRQTPATLMRPKAPAAGSRILLERIRPVWRRLSFLNKVTARNLFRYQKRFLMTVFGIAGCTGLLLCGFSIKDTVADLLPRQYEDITAYDIMAVTAGGADFDEMEAWLDARSSSIQSRLAVQVSNVQIRNADGVILSTQLYVIPDGAELSPFFTLESTEGGTVTAEQDGFYATENIGMVLDYAPGDTLLLQDMSLQQAEGPLNALVEYYLGNAVFVTRSWYETLFEPVEWNAELLCLTPDTAESAFAEGLSALDAVLSVTSVEKLKSEFSKAFILMNLVVYVVLVLAGALAFVVLFTLSTTNISERDRELATIKVLGFYDTEVHRYVNKETLILTVIGIAAGLPLGVLLGDMLGAVLELPAIVFRTVVHPVSFLISGGITFGFAIVVDLITNGFLDRIDPIEALKSVE